MKLPAAQQGRISAMIPADKSKGGSIYAALRPAAGYSGEGE